jgi:hypothetical protein
MKKLFVFLAAIVFLSTSCDKITFPHTSNSGISEICDTLPFNTSSTNTDRRILLEKYSGHKCPPCPGADYVAEGLETTFGDQVVIVNIRPEHPQNSTENNPNGSYGTDWVIEEGTHYFDIFTSNFGMPIGVINRKEFSNSFLVYANDWPATINTLVNDIPQMNIQTFAEFDNNSRTVCVNSEVEFLNNSTGDFRIVHYLIEDSVIDWQLNGSLTGHPNYSPGDVEFYINRHILRDVFDHVSQPLVNGTGNIWGKEVIYGNANTGEKVHVVTSLSDVPANWDENQFSIVAYVFDNTTKEVLQVIEEHVTIN